METWAIGEIRIAGALVEMHVIRLSNWHRVCTLLSSKPDSELYMNVTSFPCKTSIKSP